MSSSSSSITETEYPTPWIHHKLCGTVCFIKARPREGAHWYFGFRLANSKIKSRKFYLSRYSSNRVAENAAQAARLRWCQEDDKNRTLNSYRHIDAQTTELRIGHEGSVTLVDRKSIGKGQFRKMCMVRLDEDIPLNGGTEAWAVGCESAVDAYNKIKPPTVKKAFVEAIGDLSKSICETAFFEKEKEKEKEKKEREERAKAISEPFIAEIDSIMSSFNSSVFSR